MNPIASIGAGLVAASNRFDQASASVSSAAAGSGDLASAITDQIGARIAFEAEAKVMQSMAQTEKQTLNILV
jgi:hypothetical protein